MERKMVSNRNHDKSLISRSMLRALGLALLATICLLAPVYVVAVVVAPRDVLRFALAEPFSLT